MKRVLFVALAGIVMIALSSCDSTEPVATPLASEGGSGDSGLDKARCGGSIEVSEMIPFGFVGPNPLEINQLRDAQGNIGYNMSRLPVLARDLYSFSLDLNVSILPLGRPSSQSQIWNFDSQTDETVEISASKPTILLREYHTGGPSSFVTLYVRYEVNPCSVTISSMWAVQTIPGPHVWEQ